MQPLIVSTQIIDGVSDFLRANFPSNSDGFVGIMDRFLADRNQIFKGPYLGLPLPFRKLDGGASTSVSWHPCNRG